MVSKGSGEKLYLKDIARVFKTLFRKTLLTVLMKKVLPLVYWFPYPGADSLISQELVQEYMETSDQISES
ncbi:MAG: hypothetical protein Ct9H300mP4_03840 [Gammaproteobacteria bacterium]|nr:MAG: hypothetical protein Ct9H300mP4_03840 [Gammaproteobacteria bacterium]